MPMVHIMKIQTKVRMWLMVQEFTNLTDILSSMEKSLQLGIRQSEYELINFFSTQLYFPEHDLPDLEVRLKLGPCLNLHQQQSTL